MPISFRSLVSIVGALMLLGGAIQAQENCNFFTQHQCTGPYVLDVTPSGTPDGDAVKVCLTCDNPMTNPYANCPGHSCSATLNADGSTTVVFNPGPNCTDMNMTDHFGVVGTNPGWFAVLSGSYSCGTTAISIGNLGTGKTTVCPAGFTTRSVKPGARGRVAGKAKENTRNNDSGRLVSAALDPPLDTNSHIISVTTALPSGSQYALFYVRGTQAPPPAVQTPTNTWDGSGVWVELPYPGGATPPFNFENHTGADIWLNDVGYRSEIATEIPIDHLNYINYPPSMLTGLPCMNGMVLHDGDSIPIDYSCASSPTAKQMGKPEPDGLQSSSGLPQTQLK